MATGSQYVLSERTLAIEVLENERKAVTIPAGAIIEIVSRNNDRTIDVLWGSRRVEIFAVDLNMRGSGIKERRAQA